MEFSITCTFLLRIFAFFSVVKCYGLVKVDQKDNKNILLQFKYNMKEVSVYFQKKTSNDFYMDPCKSDGYSRTKRAALVKKERIWENGVIPFEIDKMYSGFHRALFKQAMMHWENYTCIKFIERNKEKHQNYIIFVEKPCGCCSFVGKRGNGGQAISIGKDCDKFGIIVHEIGHALGFWHEHTRPDRDKYVNIIKENVITGQEYNFKKLSMDEINSLDIPYDYNSIMHYGKSTFSKGPYLDTIQPIKISDRKYPQIGQRMKLSEEDIAQTNRLYNCPKCGRTYQTNSATFFPPFSTKEVSCEWRISGANGEKIFLNITNFDIAESPDCRTDYLEIRDGYWHKSPKLGKFCGTRQLPLLKSSGKRMLVTYVSKNPKPHAGFTAKYEAICGGDLFIDSEGHLESPNYPEEYQSNKECFWKITVPRNHQVVLRFQYFDIENHDSCAYDYIEIKDGMASNSSTLKKYCGSTIPPDVVSSSSQLLIRFVSDGSNQKTGFSALIMKEFDECSKTDHGCKQKCVNTLGSYICTCYDGFELHSDGKNCEDACGGIINVSNGTITSPSFPDLYPTNKKCVWEIIGQPQYRIYIHFTHFDLEGNSNSRPQLCEYDRLEIYSKFKEKKLKKHGLYCGAKKPGPIMSEENSMRIIFMSDGSIQKSGFSAVFITDWDECSVKNGGCEHECVKTLGSYSCKCHNGYTLAENGQECKKSCKFEISLSYGSLTSPNYPDHYFPKLDCVWHFLTVPGHRVKISFQFFEVELYYECLNDYVEFYDGPSQQSPSLGRFCGSKLPDIVIASTNQLFMLFRSDASVQKNGFRATHSTICGGKLLAHFEKQYLYSHAEFGVSNYGNLVDCEWTIESSEEYYVKITFLIFNIEDEKDCAYDFVEISNGLDFGLPSYGKFCGSKKPVDIISTNEALTVLFKSDESIVNEGFSLVYEAVEDDSNRK